VVGGLDVIVNNLGLKAPDGSKIGLRDIAYHVLSQSPEQLKQLQIGNAQQAATSQIGALHSEVRGLKEQLQQMHTAQQFTYTRSQVDQFADSHPRFDELGTQIEQELKLGFDLETAYRRAELLAPATQAAQTRGSPTSAQTRPADRSISGSPGGSAQAAPRRSEKPVGRREAIENAVKRVRGGA
jgi:TolA-binding protein